MSKIAKNSTTQGLTRDRVIIALRAAAEYPTRRISLKLVKRAADDLGVSQSALRSYLRKDRKAAAVKRKIEAEWRAKANAKTNARIEKLKRTNARFRALMEAAERGEPEKRIRIDFAILDECAREWSDKLKNLKI